MNVLITSASRKVSLVRAFQEALSHEGGGKVVAVDTSPLSPALYFADEYYLVPPSHKPDFLAVMLRLCRQLGINLLIPTRDEELPFFAEHKQEFADLGCVVMVADPIVVRTCQDKKLFIEFCQENGFVTPRSYELEDPSVQIEFPLFIKPRHGKSGHHTIRVDSREDLELALGRVPDAIVQEFVQAPEYTVDLFADFPGNVISVVPRERIRIVGGESFVGKTTYNPKLIKEAARLARALGLVGHNTIQCFLDGDAVKFIEVNPRFGGGASLGFAAGAPTPLFLIKLLKGEFLSPLLGEFKDNYFMLRYTQDLFLDSEALTNRMFL